ncbi:MAG: DNA primase [Candidatus Moranbacteria bacterium]|nr:DNA primase [Candidatus Moranbacteria bacterium]
MNNNIEEIKARLNIVDVVGEYVRLTKGGANWKGLCPFHSEKSPSFMVNEEKQIFHCFGCSKGGDVFTFVQEIESLDFRETLKMLAEKAGVQLEQYQGVPQEKDHKKRILEALELATKFFETQLWKGMGKDKVLGYLNERGISDDSIRNFRLGYAPAGWDNILKFLLTRGFSLEEISKTGLLVQKENGSGFYDRFRDRIMFPIQDVMGVVVGYSARVAPGQDESQAKYINSPETLVYHKSKALYGLSHAKQNIKQKNFTLLVEGQMDVIACHQAGLQNTVAVSGTALTSDHITILRRYSENITMLFDMDSAGQKATQKSVQLYITYLAELFKKDLIPLIVFLKSGKDAAETAKNNPKDLLDAVSKPLNALEYLLDNIVSKYDKNTSAGRSSIIKEWFEIISNIPNESEMNRGEKVFWSKKLAYRIDIEEKFLLDVLKATRSNSDNRRFERNNNEKVSSKSENLNFDRLDIIRETLAGLIISDKIIWQETTEKESVKPWAQNDKILKFLFDKGPQVDFSYEKLLHSIPEEQTKKRLSELYFAAKYRFSQDGVVEYAGDELRRLVAVHIDQYVKELQKNKLHSIMKEIKSAEERGDKEALKKLMSEFSTLSQESK